MGRTKQLVAEITASLAKGTPHPDATPADWKRLIVDIKKRFHAATSDQQRALINEEYKAAQLGERAAKQGAAVKPTFVTGTNLFALKNMVLEHGGPTFPNRVAAVHAPHLKRCFAAGLIENTGGNRVRLTAAGRTAVADELIADIDQANRWSPRENMFVPAAERRAELLAEEVAKHQAKRKRLEDVLAKVTAS